jgi:hypothetical protein
MNLSSKSLTVVSTDGSYFGVDSAYLVDLSSCSDEFIEDFQDGPDRNRAQVALDRGVKLTDILNDDEPPFVSKCLMYEIEGCIHDDGNPEFAYYVPCESGSYWMVDCWIVDEEGNVHPGYNVAGVPVATKNFVAIGDSPMITN